MTELHLHYHLEEGTRCVCGNCDWTGGAEELHQVYDAQERLYPGETVPAGQCPSCGALAHLTDEET